MRELNLEEMELATGGVLGGPIIIQTGQGGGPILFDTVD